MIVVWFSSENLIPSCQRRVRYPAWEPAEVAVDLPVVEGIGLQLHLKGLAGFHAGLPLKPARMKWFDATNGFGFANAFRKDEDLL